MNNLGIRLQQARKISGHTLRSLANLLGLSHAAIKKYEDGDVYPSSDMLIKLAKILEVRIDFFFRPIGVSLESLKFRKRKKLSKKSEETIKFEVVGQIERRLELESFYPSSPMSVFELPPDFPQKINSLEEIECAAERLRLYWKLGLAPIHGLINAFESRGIRVFIINTDDDHFDGFSTIIDNQPIIVIRENRPGDRQRFNLAHELGHYVLKDRLPPEIDEEQACNRFAGALLFPREAVFQSIGKKRRAIEWQELLFLKEQFQLSMKAICYRLKDLGIIQESSFKNLMIGFSKNDWNRKEPLEIPSERAHAFDQMLFHALGEKYIGESKAAELLSCSITQLKAFRHVQNSPATTD